MEGFAYACAVLLAAVLVRAGAAKLARPTETASGFRSLGLPAPAAMARVVPIAEIALGAVLLSFPRPGALAALTVLGAFTVVVLRAVRAGVATPCTCFGVASDEPVSRGDVLRNVLLMGAAVGALATAQPVVPSPGAVILLAAAVAAGLALLRLAARGRR